MLIRLICSVLLLLCLQMGDVLARQAATNNSSQAKPRQSAPATVQVEAVPEVSILGAAENTEEQMVAFIRARNPQPRINCQLEELVAAYFREGVAEGVRGDMALCQALKETGFFRYGGTVKPQQNNFCGLGTTNATAGGASFTTPERGVRAHIQHLLAYASTQRPRQAVIDPRYDIVRKLHANYAGGITTWSGLNGTWAVPGKGYGQSIVSMWQQARQNASGNAKLMQEYTRRIAKGEAAASLARGKLYAQQKQYDKALADYQVAGKYGPLKAEALLYQGVLYQEAGNTAEAVKAFESSLAADSSNAVARACLNNLRQRSVTLTSSSPGKVTGNEAQEIFMQEAIKEADSNLLSKEGGPFGAVIVQDGKLIAKAHNRVLKLHDPSAHAEIEAIRAAGKKLGTHDLSGCVLYTNCYPCPMCLGAIIWSNIKLVYYGNTAADAAAIGFRNDYIYSYITAGCQDEAVLELKSLCREKTISSFRTFAAQPDKKLY